MNPTLETSMKVVYAKQEFPSSWTKSMFLVGPTPRDENPVVSWRIEALRILEEKGYDGVVFIPEHEDGKWSGNYLDQVEWEKEGLRLADKIVSWVPRDLKTMPAFTTNVEFGRWVSSRKILLGHPPDAPKTRYLDWLLQDETDGNWHPTLEGTLVAALTAMGEGSERKGGERYVPLYVWETQMFQDWYDSLKKVGNRLDDADVLWTFRVRDLVFSWILQVKVWVASEGRYKENEWIFSQKDISTIVLYHKPESDPLPLPRQGSNPFAALLDTTVVLIREFRSPVRNSDGFVHELAGGSSMKPDQDPLEVASSEVEEETGLMIPADRFRSIGSRQVAATLSTHRAHTFVVELTDLELEQAKGMAAINQVHGVEEDTERTYVEVTSLRDLLEQDLVDWSMMGMLFQALVG